MLQKGGIMLRCLRRLAGRQLACSWWATVPCCLAPLLLACAAAAATACSKSLQERLLPACLSDARSCWVVPQPVWL